MKYLFIFILNIVLFSNISILHAYSNNEKSRAQKYVKLCFEYNNRGEYDLAISACTKAINIYPYDFYAYFERGLAYGYKKQYDMAIKDYTESIILNPNYSYSYYNRGWAYGEKKQFDLAIKDYTNAIRLNPNDIKAYFNRGFAYIKKGLYDPAIKDFSVVIRKDPQNAKAYFWLAYAYGEKKQYDLAIKNYSKTIQLIPNYPSAYCNRGFCFMQKGLYELAIKELTIAIQLNPKLYTAYLNRGLVYAFLHKWKEASQDFYKAITMNSSNPYLRLNYAFVLHKLGLEKKSKKQIQYALTLDPNILEKKAKYLGLFHSKRDRVPLYFYAEEYLFASKYTSAPLYYIKLANKILGSKESKKIVSKTKKKDQTKLSENHCVQPYPNRYLFGILISNYEELPKLSFVKHDKKILLKLATCFLGVPQKHILILENSTLGKIKHTTRNFFSKITKRDALVFIYYSGHGITDSRGEFYILPKDASTQTEEDLRETALSLKEFKKKISLARGLKLVMLDACRVQMPWKPAVLLRKKVETNDMTLLFGTKFGKTSVREKNGESSAFISALYQMATSGLTNIDQNDDGYVEVNELIMPLKKWMRKISSDPSQSPEVWGKKDIPVFPVE